MSGIEKGGSDISSASSITRREFLKLLPLGLGGLYLASCSRKIEEVPALTTTEPPKLSVTKATTSTMVLEPTSTKTPELTPTPNLALERVNRVLSEESIWLSAGVPEEIWKKWKEDVEKGSISPEFETFTAQATIVERLLSKGDIQVATSLDEVNPEGLSFKVEFVESEEGKLPVVFAVDKEGGAYITSINMSIDKAGFPKLDYNEADYASLFKVPELPSLTWKLVNFNRVMYEDKTTRGMPSIVMTPQDLNTNFDKFYYNGLWSCSYYGIYCSYKEVMDGDYMQLGEPAKTLAVSPKRPAVAIYTIAGLDPRLSQKIIGLEYAQEGEEKYLVRTVKVVDKINLFLSKEELKEVRRFYVKENRDVVFTTFWLPCYADKGPSKKGEENCFTLYRKLGKHKWASAVVWFSRLPAGFGTEIEDAAYALVDGPYAEIEANNLIYPGFESGEGYLKIPKSMSLQELVDKAKRVNNGDLKDGEVGYNDIVFWIYRKLGVY